MAATIIAGYPGSRVTANQVTVADSATLIIDADTRREELTLVNGSSETIYLGGSDVSDSNGFPLLSGQGLSLYRDRGANGAWYGIVESGSETIGYLAIA